MPLTGGGGLDEECERETEKEVEVQEEVERRVPKMRPASETDWDYSSAVTSAIPAGLATKRAVSFRVMKVLPLKKVVGEFLEGDPPAALEAVKWADIYCTQNFVYTVAVTTKKGALNEYLRPLDAVLVYPNGHGVVLLSEREADNILARMWQSGRGQVNQAVPYLVNLAYERQTAIRLDSQLSPPKLQVGGQLFKQTAGESAAWLPT
eukprot:1191049-Prorocentrum_minimum.AAC.1